jgi:hypothetical protein
MNEHLIEAREELKRLEHIIYVSLKYSRTVDVLMNALNRLVSVYELLIGALLEKAIEEGKADAMPKSPARQGLKLGEVYEDDEVMKLHLTFYQYLKNILKSSYARREEFRRHVTHIVELDKSTSEIDIDCLENMENFAHKFLQHARDLIEGKKVEED